MMRAIAFVLALSLFVFARAAGDESTGRFATMALGFVLVVATLVGEAGDRAGLPRITGYLIVGLVAGPEILNLVTPAMASRVRLVNGLAVALIAFGAGMELDVHALRRQWRGLVRHGGILLFGLFFGLFVLTLVAAPWLPFTAHEPWARRAAIAVMLAATLATFSPTVVMAVISEVRAKGPLADRVLALVVLADLALVLVFTFSSTAARMLDGRQADLALATWHVTWELIGSLGVGLLAGAAVLAYRLLVDRQSELVVAGMCLALAEVGSRLGLSPLLSCLAAGLVVRNAAPDAAHAMHVLLERVRLPVLVLFFAAAGATLRLDEITRLAPFVLLFAVARAVLLVTLNRAGARSAGFDPALARLVPTGLLSQAGVTLGLAIIVGREFGDWGAQVETLVVATISLHQLAGPILFRWGLTKAGEVPPPSAEPAAPIALAQA